MTEVPHCGRGPAGIVDLVRADEWVRPRGRGGTWSGSESSSDHHLANFIIHYSLDEFYSSHSLSLNRDKLSVKCILWGPMTETFI